MGTPVDTGRDEFAEAIQAWIHVATKDLCDAARDRVRDEVNAHYTDIVQGEVERGRTEADAHHAALEAIGDPESAARSLRRSHLTRKEAKHLANVVASFPKGGRLHDLMMLALAVWLSVALYVVSSASQERGATGAALLLPVFFGVVLLDSLVRRVLSPRLLRAGHHRRALLWMFASGGLAGALPFCAMMMSIAEGRWPLLAILLLLSPLCGVALARHACLSLKLIRNGLPEGLVPDGDECRHA